MFAYLFENCIIERNTEIMKFSVCCLHYVGRVRCAAPGPLITRVPGL